MSQFGCDHILRVGRGRMTVRGEMIIQMIVTEMMIVKAARYETASIILGTLMSPMIALNILIIGWLAIGFATV